MRKLALFLSRPSRAMLRELRAAQETVDRLEIAQRRDRLRINELATDLERLSDRLCATQGRLLGGSKNNPRGRPSGQQELRLEDIPHGDKKALREYFRKHPPADARVTIPEDETEH